PDQKVDVVDALVHQAAATAIVGTAPVRGLVVLLGPIPVHDNVTHDQPAQPALIDEASHRDWSWVVPVLVDDGQLHTGGTARVDQAVGRGEADLERLLDDHVLTGSGGSGAQLGM